MLTLATDCLVNGALDVQKLSNYLEAEKSVKLSDAVNGVKIKHIGKQVIAKGLIMQLSLMQEALAFKTTITPYLTQLIIIEIINRYREESYEGIVLAFKEARAGNRGEIYNISQPTVFKWINLYIADKKKYLKKVNPSSVEMSVLSESDYFAWHESIYRYKRQREVFYSQFKKGNGGIRTSDQQSERVKRLTMSMLGMKSDEDYKKYLAQRQLK